MTWPTTLKNQIGLHPRHHARSEKTSELPGVTLHPHPRARLPPYLTLVVLLAGAGADEHWPSRPMSAGTSILIIGRSAWTRCNRASRTCWRIKNEGPDREVAVARPQVRPRKPTRAPQRRYLNIILLGPPGRARARRPAILSERRGLVQLSTGDMLREALGLGHEMGQARGRGQWPRGSSSPNEIVIGLIRENWPRAARG